jgi:hypothetical protein
MQYSPGFPEIPLEPVIESAPGNPHRLHLQARDRAVCIEPAGRTQAGRVMKVGLYAQFLQHVLIHPAHEFPAHPVARIDAGLMKSDRHSTAAKSDAESKSGQTASRDGYSVQESRHA